LRYDYDANGLKRRFESDTNVIKYAFPFEYDQNNQLKRLATNTGQYSSSKGWMLYLKDHLGNVRVVFDSKGKVLQRTDYYPFGLDIARDSLSNLARLTTNRYKFQGKEEQLSIGIYDFGARNYDPQTGRMNSVDALADHPNQIDKSSYVAFWNNPLKYTDPDGQCPDCPQQFMLWLIGGYYKYLKGGVDYARNEVQHNTKSEYTERVPEQVRNINYTIGKTKAIQTSIEGATQIVESHMAVMGALEAGAVGAVGPVISAMTKPQGLSFSQFGQLSKILKNKVGGIGDDIFIQGSRASGSAKKTSDIDIGISVSEDKFNELIKTYFGSPNVGSAKEKNNASCNSNR
jgi:RHS repeat-associated protein